MRGKRENVGGPFPEGRQHDRKDAEAVVEILPEDALGHQALEIPVRRRDHTHVHGDGLRPPDPLERPLLQYPEELALQGVGHLTDFVKEQGTSMRQLEAPPPLAHGPGEGPFLVTEQLALQQGLGQGGAVHGDEGLLGPRTPVMDGPRHQLLSRPRLARYKDRRVRGRHRASQLQGGLHLAVPCDDLAEGEHGLGGLAESGRLVRHPPLFQDTPYAEAQLLGIGERLQQVVNRPHPHGLHGALDRSERRQDDHRGARIVALHLFQQLQAGDPGHLRDRSGRGESDAWR